MKFWDYGKHDLDGYQQSGDIHGKYFGTWLRQLDDGKVIIVSFGDETKRYWLQMGNCFHGNYATPERAALEAEKLLSANAIEKMNLKPSCFSTRRLDYSSIERKDDDQRRSVENHRRMHALEYRASINLRRPSSAKG